jgi:hypothetical protein
VLFGATRITTLFVLVPQIGAWGCPAVIIRYLTRRRRQGWAAILLLGLALAVAVECVILQTSFAPLVGVDPSHAYGRALGVNWVYLLWALGYESIWVVVLPIQLTELIFPARRDDPWLGRRGLIIAAAVFVLASFAAWYLWTRIAAPMYSHGEVYRPPLLSLLIAVAGTVLLVLGAFGLRRGTGPERTSTRPVAQPWLVGVVAFVLGLLWSALVFLAYGVAPALPVAIPITGGIALACVAFFLVRYWSWNPGWQDTHRLALVFGALVASMLAGFWVIAGAQPIDFSGKLVLNVIAVLLMAYLARQLRRRKAAG